MRDIIAKTPFSICTMPNSDWYVCNRFGDEDMLNAALAAGGDIDHYDYSEMCQVLGLSDLDDDCDDPDAFLMGILENDQSHQAMLNRIKTQLGA